MANKIKNLQLFLEAVEKDVREDSRGSIDIFGFGNAFKMRLGGIVVRIAAGKISEQAYINHVKGI